MNYSPQQIEKQPPTRRKRNPLPVELKPEHVTAIIDTREQLPLNLAPLLAERGTLTTGDYSVKALEDVVAFERKSLPDYIGCVGQGRERFERCVKRLQAYPVRAIIVEATWADLEAGEWLGSVTPAQAMGLAFGCIASGVPVIMAGTRERAERFVARLLFIAARRRWREARPLIDFMLAEEGEQ